MSCLFDIPKKERHCQFCSAICDERPVQATKSGTNEKADVMHIWGYDWECAMEGHRIIHPDYPYVYYSKDDIEHKGDVVKLTLSKSKVDHINHWDNTIYYPEFGGGLMRSMDTFGYGTFSAEVWMPKGKGLWPSFWLCGEGSWPNHGEIDVLEGYSDHNYLRIFTPYFPWINPSWTTTTNVHYSGEDGMHKQIGSRSVSIFKQFDNPSNTFVKYECKWTPDEIVISVNGKVVRRDTMAVKKFSQLDNKMRWILKMVNGDPDTVEQYANRECEMRVIFNLLCENPNLYDVEMYQPMLIKNFEYKPLR